MVPDIQLMHTVWQDNSFACNKKSVGGVKFEEILSSLFSVGPFYFYNINFFDMSLSHVSSQVEELHGIPISQLKNINDILCLIHPDDMVLVAKFEEQAYNRLRQHLGVEKITLYKISYNFRFKTVGGSYKLFNHQSLILEIDEFGGIVHSLNIHTLIDHIVTENKNTYSLIGLMGEPSFLNISLLNEVEIYEPILSYSVRETEIIKLFAKGFTCPQIADQLRISPHTANTHRRNLLLKSQSKNIAELVAKSILAGLA